MQEAAGSQWLSARQCSVNSLVVGPAQYPVGWVVVALLNRHGLWQTHTWKELLAIDIYVVGAIASIILALKGVGRTSERSFLSWFALVLALVNVFPTLVVMGGW